MAGYLDVYRKKLGNKPSSIRERRIEENKATLNRNFQIADGYKLVTYWDRTNVDDGHKDEETIEIISRTGTNGYERFFTFRPDTQIAIGTYVKYKDGRTFIIRELSTEEPMPTYRAFECNQVLRLKGCPIDFPCFSYNSTYSSKGILDLDRVYGLDSRNKIYIQKNVFSNRLWEHHRGYRIQLGDKETRYTFYITEMDDLSYKGMYVVSLKIDEVNPYDGEEYAHNDNVIDFSDLIVNDPDTGEVIPNATATPILHGDMYHYLDDEVELIPSKKIKTWEFDSEMIQVLEQTETVFKGVAKKAGLTVVKATDTDNKEVEKPIMIK